MGQNYFLLLKIEVSFVDLDLNIHDERHPPPDASKIDLKQYSPFDCFIISRTDRFKTLAHFDCWPVWDKWVL